jgi:transposase
MAPLATKPFASTPPATRSSRCWTSPGAAAPFHEAGAAAYCKEGSTALVDQRLGGNRARLTPAQMADLKGRLHRYTPADLFGQTVATAEGQFWTVPDLQRALEQWYGVHYQSRSSYHRYFDLCGFSYQRPAKVYKSRSAAKVAEFEA